MKTIILINGVARSGKDTFAEFLQSHLEKFNNTHSMVLPNALGVKKIAKSVYEWNEEKDERGRQLLIDITNTGYNYDVHFWEKFSENTIEGLEVMSKKEFTHVIVPDFRYKNTYNYYVERGYNVITIMVVRPNHDNELGALKLDISEQPMNLKFNHYINNSGTLEDLEHQAKFVAEFIARGGK